MVWAAAVAIGLVALALFILGFTLLWCWVADWLDDRAYKQITKDINKEKAKVSSINVCLHCGGSTCVSTYCHVTGWSAFSVTVNGGSGSSNAVQVNPGQSYPFTVGSGSGGSGGSSSGGGGSTSFHSGGIVAYGGSGGNPGLSPITCASCGTTIPSGVVCSLDCLKKYDTAIYIPMGVGCLDCGSGLAPSYHPGCSQQGRVTGYLPIPGPAGSPGLTAAQAAPQKKPVPFSGMAGYSEAGTPDDWDLELGYIRGYRWFSIKIPESWAGIRRRDVRAGYYDVNGKPEINDEGMLDLPDEEIPLLTGAYGGTWQDGVNEAKCSKNGHEPPEVRGSGCGCGYWAYFDENLAVSSVLGGWNTVSNGTVGICVLGCVEGTGRVIVGEKGFRSQYAKIVGLTVGQAAVPDLMWWRSTEYAQDSFGNSYSVAPGSSGAGLADFIRNGSGTPYQVQCSDEEVYNRLARIEDMLGRKYPSARIVSSEDTLRKLMPPDRSS